MTTAVGTELIASFSPGLHVTEYCGALTAGAAPGPRSSLDAMGCGREHRGPVSEEGGTGVQGSHHFLGGMRLNR